MEGRRWRVGQGGDDSTALEIEPHADGDLAGQVAALAKCPPVEVPRARRDFVAVDGDALARGYVAERLVFAPSWRDCRVRLGETIVDLDALEHPEQEQHLVGQIQEPGADRFQPLIETEMRIWPEVVAERKTNDGVEAVRGECLHVAWEVVDPHRVA